MVINFQRLHPDAVLPTYKTAGSSGADACSVVGLVIPAGKIALVPLGFAVSMPLGMEIQVRPRSGLALKHGVTVLNTPGTIDSDFRGELKVILINLGEEDFTINKGDRVAQLVVSSVESAEYWEKEQLDDTARGTGGFGSTGRN